MAFFSKLKLKSLFISQVLIYLRIFFILFSTLLCPHSRKPKCTERTRNSKRSFLTTVPSFVTAHTFCASRGVPSNMQRYFCAIRWPIPHENPVKRIPLLTVNMTDLYKAVPVTFYKVPECIFIVLTDKNKKT